MSVSGSIARGPIRHLLSRSLPCSALVACALASCLSSAPLNAAVRVEVVGAGDDLPAIEADTIIATPWDVRREAQELMQDLSDGRVELSILLDRTQQLLRDHGNDLIAYGGGWVPLAEAMRRHMRDAELLDDYAKFFHHVANRELQTILARTPQSLSELADFGHRYPGTAAAKRAWRLLADRAWDLGHLGLYLTYAPQAGDREDPARRQRLEAARTLLLPSLPDELPESLDNLGRMWSIAGIPNRKNETSNETTNRQHLLRRRQQQQMAGRTGFLFNHHAGTRVAACDGSRLVLLDPLLGNQIGETLVLGNNAHAVPRAPAYGNGTFVALTLNNGSPRMVAISDEGNQRWVSENAGLSNTLGISDPIIIADIATFAYTRVVDSYVEIHAAAFALSDGELRWRRLIAKGHSPQRHRFAGGRPQAPDICAHQGSLIVLSNNGLIARLAPTGVVTRIWNYPSLMTRQNRFDNQTNRPKRLGNVLSDGRHIVAAPHDHAGLILLDPAGERQRFLSEVGTTDELVDCLDGKALLVGQRISLLDVAKGELLWTHFGQGDPKQVAGFLGPNRAVTALDNKVYLLDPETGRRTSARAIPKDSSLTIADGVLITAGPDASSGGDQIIVIGYGDKHGFERLLSKAQSNPSDFRPLLALASLHRARGNIDDAYQAILQALDRGAPAHHAREAGRLVRLKISRTLGGKSFEEPLAMFQRLETFAPSLRSERLWWQGRHAELTGAVEEATKSYLAVLAEDTAQLHFINDLKADLHALASAGLNRLGTGLRPSWIQPYRRADLDQQRVVDSQMLEGPSGGKGFLETPVVRDNIIYGYRGGHLQAYDAATKQTLWRRANDAEDMPMLGVYLDRRQVNQPIQIGVIPGSAAASAGLRDGDILLELNGTPLSVFEDLSQTVARLGIGGEFTLVVKRGDEGDQEGEIVTCTGRFGSALWRAVSAGERFLVIRDITIRRDEGGNWSTARDAQTPTVEVLDRATGKVHWRRLLRTSTNTTTLSDPLLVGDRLLILNDGEDLLAFDMQAPADAPIWQRRGAGINTTRVELINDHLLVITRPESGLIELVEADTGKSLFEVPGDPNGPVLLHDGACFVHDAAGHLQCWELGIAYDSWRSETRHLTPLAVHKNSFFVKDRRRQLRVLHTVNGREQRRFSEWSTVHEACIDGDRLYLYGHRQDGNQVIAAVALRSSTPSWERELPYKLELRGGLFLLADGVGCMLDSLDSEPSILGIGKDGSVTHAVQLRPGESVLNGASGLLLHGPDGLRQPSILPTRPTASITQQALELSETEAEDEKLLSVAIKEHAADADWQQQGTGSFACLSVGERLLILIRSPANAPDLTLHLGQTSSAVDVQGQLLRARRGDVPQFEAGKGGWSLVKVLHVQEADGQWISAALLAPPLLKQVGVPLRLTPASKDVPWWYRPAWQLVERPLLPTPLP